jgi:hypothetical protein
VPWHPRNDFFASAALCDRAELHGSLHAPAAVTRRIFSAFARHHGGSWASELLFDMSSNRAPRDFTPGGLVTQQIRELIDRILSSYDEMDGRFSSSGGLGSLLSLYEQMRRELDRVSFQELDRMTGEIKNVIEALLTIDYELRKVQNLKLVFDSRSPQTNQ